MENWNISFSRLRTEDFAHENHVMVVIDDLLEHPQTAIDCASLQKFAKITPQYPGIRAPLPEAVCRRWLDQLAPRLDAAFGMAAHGWQMQAWFSLVTTPPGELIPLQRFPHVDGTDPRQLAMMLYLHRSEHGGTGFFRHRSTGLSALTDADFPRYRAALEDDVRRSGLPQSAYVTDGAPHFELIHASTGAFNQAVFYRGNILHSGLIDNTAALSPDPRKGRLTINAFFRPNEPSGRAE